MSIDVSHVSKRFGDFVALDDVSVSLPTGQLTALLGPSGGGKSTLLRIIAGLDSADEGSVSIEGVEATGLPARKRNVGFVFQHYAVFKHMSVAKNVAFGLEIRKRPKDEIAHRVDELLRLVHLQQFAHRLPSQLSGGQREQVGTPDTLYDEPANDFVMGFLGEVTQLGGLTLRPHDIDVSTTPLLAGATPGTVTRLLRVGFEVRVTVTPDAGDEVTVVMTRTHSRSLGLDQGHKVWLTPATGATTVPAMRSVASVG
jgi:ABC-type sulfate/molybdate transport systems ATPase subunit